MDNKKDKILDRFVEYADDLSKYGQLYETLSNEREPSEERTICRDRSIVHYSIAKDIKDLISLYVDVEKTTEEKPEERLLITAKEMREQQVKYKAHNEEETRNAVRNAFPLFMQKVNKKLISQSGCGCIFKLHNELKELNITFLSSCGTFQWDIAIDEIISLLKEQFKEIDDFILKVDNSMVMITRMR